jgi:hypothetical protein
MLDFEKLPPLTDSQVSAGARPGESWEQARARLEADNYALPPCPIGPDYDYGLAGPISEFEGLDGEPIDWEPDELGS